MEMGNHDAEKISAGIKKNGPNSMAVNAGFKRSRPNNKTLPLKDNSDELSNLNKILDRICQIHSTAGKLANHTHRNCWVLKQSGRLNAKHKGLDTPSEDDDEPHQQSTGRPKDFPARSQNSKLTPCDNTEQ